jgi:hypothetical protein
MNTENALSFTIRYSLTRSEVLRSFVRSVAVSPRFRLKIMLYSLLPAVCNLLLTLILERTLTKSDVLTAIALAGLTFMLFPILIAIRAKTSERTLTISKDGISTVIGKKNGQISWKTICIVSETPQFVLVARGNGNCFFIPNRAFSAVEERQHFMAELRGWMGAEI